MESKFSTTTLKSLVSNVRNAIVGGPFGSNLVSKDYTETGVPVIRGKNMGFGKYVAGDFVYVSQEKAESLKSNIARPNDLVFTQRGTLGQVAITPRGSWSSYVVSQSQMKATIDPEKADVNYLYYYFSSPSQIAYLISNSIQTGVPHTNLTQLKSHPISIPNLTSQKAIAHILGSLDNKIELNRQMNETLEAMAQALFKSWFVDFDPVIDNALAAGNTIPDVFAERAAQRKAMNKDEAINPLFPDAFEYTEKMGWIPEGWESVKLDTLLEVKYGKDHKKLDDGNIPVYGSGGLMRLVNKSLYSGESILIPRKGTLSNIMFVDEEFWSVDTMFFTIPKLQHTAKYLFQQLKKLDFSSMNVGSAVPSMTTKVLNDLNILKPSSSALEEFDRLATGFFNKAKALNEKSTALSKLRDTLLPKFLSGELRIPDAEKLIEEAQA